MNKEDNFKEKFKEALISTLKVISDDYKINENENKNLKSKNLNFLEIDSIKNKEDIKIKGITKYTYKGFAYYLTKEFFKHCTKNKILNKKINFNKPVILIHGNKDNIVKETMPIKIMKKLSSQNVQIKFLKSSDHSLSKSSDLISIKNSLDNIRELI